MTHVQYASSFDAKPAREVLCITLVILPSASYYCSLGVGFVDLIHLVGVWRVLCVRERQMS